MKGIFLKKWSPGFYSIWQMKRINQYGKSLASGASRPTKLLYLIGSKSRGVASYTPRIGFQTSPRFRVQGHDGGCKDCPSVANEESP